MSPKLNFSKVKTISVEDGTVNVWYKSGVFRQFQNVDLDLLKERANQGQPDDTRPERPTSTP